jgi:hypothetical protein
MRDSRLVRRVLAIGALGGFLLAVPASGIAQDQSDASPDISYRPPLRGAPHGRVGGATRGATGDFPTIEALAPDHTGLTTKVQPTVYYYTSASIRWQLQLTVTSDDSFKPLVEVDLPRPSTGGIQSVRFADFNVTLKPGVEYAWSIAVIVDPRARSTDIVAGGIIKRTELLPDVAAVLAGEPRARRAWTLAQNGLWYDALEALGDDRASHAARAALLEQVGLTDVARYEAAASR